jgi:predicted DsbA family dithiol-disulfide isomerase
VTTTEHLGSVAQPLSVADRRTNVVVVFADVACPFTHVGLRRFLAYRQQRGRTEPTLRVRAWPLELVNGKALDGPSLAPKIEALRAGVAPDLFAGFNVTGFPATTLPAMAAEAAAYRQGLQVGERFSLAVRAALFEDGLDVSDEDVLVNLRRAHGVPQPNDSDRSAVRDDLAEGRRRSVAGSPHFFTSGDDFFCPSLNIGHDHDGYEVAFDPVGFERFVVAAFG